MSEEIKSVRIRSRQEPPGYKSGAFEGGRLDYKVQLNRISRRERQCVAFKLREDGEQSTAVWFPLEYKGRRYEDLSDDEIIDDFIRTNTVRENPTFRDGNIQMYVETFTGSGIGSTQSVPYYEIIQDPFQKTPPASRVFGRDPYYLNNGAKVYINWFSGTSVKISYSYQNITTSTQSQSGEVSIRISTNEPEIPPNEFTYNSQNNPFGVGVTPSYIYIENYWESFFQTGGFFGGWKSQYEYFIDPNTLHPVEGVFYGSTSSASYAIDGFIDDARVGSGNPTPSLSIKPNPLIKRVRVEPPKTEKDSSGLSNDGRSNVDFKTWVLSEETSDTIATFHPIYIEDSVEYQGTQSSGTSSTTSETSTKKKEKEFFDKSAKGDFSMGQDWMILGDLINAWKNKIPNYDLKLYNPSYLSPSIYDEIKYKDPIEPEQDEPLTQEEPVVLQENVNLKVYFPPEWEVKVREDCPEFKIFVGEIPKELEPGEGFQFQDDFEDLGELDDEYSEEQFVGPEEDIDAITGVAFTATELKRDISEPAPEASESEQKEAGVSFGGSNVNSPTGNVSKTKVSVPSELSSVQNSKVLSKQNMGNGVLRDISDIKTPQGDGIKGEDIVKNMNQFISDVLGPFAKFLKDKYPNLYKSWYITSATRGYVPKGGSLTSQHFKGQAIDSQILGVTSAKPDKNIELMNAILEWYKSNPVGYGQILFETRGSSCWIHWSYTRGVKRLMFARFSNDSTLKAPANKTGSYVLPPLNKKSLGF